MTSVGGNVSCNIGIKHNSAITVFTCIVYLTIN